MNDADATTGPATARSRRHRAPDERAGRLAANCRFSGREAGEAIAHGAARRGEFVSAPPAGRPRVYTVPERRVVLGARVDASECPRHPQSLCLGISEGKRQIGLARVITDRAVCLRLDGSSSQPPGPRLGTWPCRASRPSRPERPAPLVLFTRDAPPSKSSLGGTAGPRRTTWRSPSRAPPRPISTTSPPSRASRPAAQKLNREDAKSAKRNRQSAKSAKGGARLIKRAIGRGASPPFGAFGALAVVLRVLRVFAVQFF